MGGPEDVIDEANERMGEAEDDLDDVVFNGLDAATGTYLVPDLPVDQAARMALGGQPDAAYLEELRDRHGDPGKAVLGETPYDRKKLSESGWGVLFAVDDAERNEKIREQLAPLFELRQEQIGAARAKTLYRILDGKEGYRRGDSKPKWLQRMGAGGGGPCKPEILPYYILLAASPAAIPYSFEYQLAVQYGVGRLYFDDIEDYGRYARAVVTAEDRKVRRQRTAVFFGVGNPGDRATSLSTRKLIAPLAETMARECKDWDVRTVGPDDATRDKLEGLLCSDDKPAFLFTASHGLGLSYEQTVAGSHQGALVCRDWPGPIAGAGRPIDRAHYFAGDDVDALGDRSRIAGLISFHFACFGAGTPRRDSFSAKAGNAALIAQRPFVAHLPQRLLASPHGGALACIGHVDRAIPASFRWRGGGVQLGVFEQAVNHLAAGYPVGSAIDEFPERYAELTVDIDAEKLAIENAECDPDDRHLAGLWSAQMDARSYVIVGDPAVRVAVD